MVYQNALCCSNRYRLLWNVEHEILLFVCGISICLNYQYSMNYTQQSDHSITSMYCEKATIHQVTTMLATSKNVLFPGHNHLLTTGTDDPTLSLSPEGQRVQGHQYQWLAWCLWPGNRKFLEVTSMVVTWWLVAFLWSDSKMHYDPQTDSGLSCDIEYEILLFFFYGMSECLY